MHLARRPTNKKIYYLTLPLPFEVGVPVQIDFEFRTDPLQVPFKFDRGIPVILEFVSKSCPTPLEFLSGPCRPCLANYLGVTKLLNNLQTPDHVHAAP